MKTRSKFLLKSVLLLVITVLLSACTTTSTGTKSQKDIPTIDDINMSLQETYITDKNIGRRSL